ncbi:hypothetical protein L1987_21359 [Smallanthus sonchifolius]|uniref:Uncharacterized protein n=1 Tax=Smallanthus sonchifolius TaxID=185202 RepID=A0ACB9IVD3_9ASTR|nr:hypothetical protein L1987_21359 [Smallanthus sonchifolius]
MVTNWNTRRLSHLVKWMKMNANLLEYSVCGGQRPTLCLQKVSTGSTSHGSRRWKILSSRRRSNTEEVAWKQKTTTSSSPSFHELFYLKRGAEQKGDKMKSFLPYKQDLLGFFVNINRIRNKKSLF